MVRLITQANGVAALLFHVEHSAGVEWRYRWRILGDAYPARYREWREVTACEARHGFHPEIIGCPLEVQSWDAAADGWRQVPLHAVQRGICRFRVRAVEDFNLDLAKPFDAVSSIAGGGVAHYRFTAFSLAAGVEVGISGEAVGDFADNILLRAGEFFSRDPRLEIENLAPSERSFSPVLPGPAVVSLHPQASARRLFAFTGHNFRREIEAEPVAIL